MKLRLPLLIVILLALGLLFGGAIHSAHHEDEGGDCHFCQLTPSLLAGEALVVETATLLARESLPIHERVPPSELPIEVAPQGAAAPGPTRSPMRRQQAR